MQAAVDAVSLLLTDVVLQRSLRVEAGEERLRNERLRWSRLEREAEQLREPLTQARRVKILCIVLR